MQREELTVLTSTEELSEMDFVPSGTVRQVPYGCRQLVL